MAGVTNSNLYWARKKLAAQWGPNWQMVLAAELGTHRTYIAKMVQGYRGARSGEQWQRFLRLVGPEVEALLCKASQESLVNSQPLRQAQGKEVAA